MYDLEDYRDRLRGFYFDIENEFSCPIVKDEEFLMESIEDYLKYDYVPSERFDRFYDRFCYLEEGKSTECVVKSILKNKKGHAIYPSFISKTKRYCKSTCPFYIE